MDRVFVIGLIIFAFVIIFSVIVEIDTVKEERMEPSFLQSPVSELELKICNLSGVSLLMFMRSLEGKYIEISGRIDRLGFATMELAVDGVNRLIRVNISKKMRKGLNPENHIAVIGRIRRIIKRKEYLYFELSNLQLDRE